MLDEKSTLFKYGPQSSKFVGVPNSRLYFHIWFLALTILIVSIDPGHFSMYKYRSSKLNSAFTFIISTSEKVYQMH